MSFNVGTAFERFCSNLRFSDNDISTISGRYHTITKRINNDYWGSTSDTMHSLYVGSYGRDTEIFTSDIDMLVQLPYETYVKFNAYTSNGQSALLQEVKQVIEKTYSVTSLKADGQIISIPFSDGIDFEVLPAFLNNDGSYTFANSNDGGSWKTTDPKAEIEAIQSKNNECNSNLKRLCKMARAWKDKNDVDISGILIDILSYRFISTWEYRDKSYVYYDWMTRDFLKYVSEQSTTQYLWQVMGSGRYIACFGSFQSKAKKAYDKAIEAIADADKYPNCANDEWREIYGTKFPKL
jgi:predicted nucleotidyltransferase